MTDLDDIRLVDLDEPLGRRIRAEVGETAWRYLHPEGGFAIVALAGEELVGFIAVQPRPLPAPLPATTESYIDIIEVLESHRRKGVARRLVAAAARRGTASGHYQLRAWSSSDKAEAIPMWKALGFGVVPTTTFPGGQAVPGYFVTLPLARRD